ncbi:MAG: hypothetical protein U5K43_09645 [Halofilum sp. (in: g-proteobacteria)]|nr:hypothetical protein [Halofilum sp. (in: g-proteobacteria)]
MIFVDELLALGQLLPGWKSLDAGEVLSSVRPQFDAPRQASIVFAFLAPLSRRWTSIGWSRSASAPLAPATAFSRYRRSSRVPDWCCSTPALPGEDQ